MTSIRRILVAGVPRSGTTWVAGVLAAGSACTLIVEPDNEKTSLLARTLKRAEPRFPSFAERQPDPSYRELWRLVAGAPRARLLSRSWLTRSLLRMLPSGERHLSGKRSGGGSALLRAAIRGVAEAPALQSEEVRVIKTVHAVLCLDHVVEWLAPCRTVLVTRHPLAIIDSWRRLRMPDATRLWRAALERLVQAGCAPIDEAAAAADPLMQMALQLGWMQAELARFAAAAGTALIRVEHEALCADPPGQFRSLFERVGLDWTEEVERRICRDDRVGSGYRAVRLAKSEIGKWRGRFDRDEQDRIGAVLHAFGWGGTLDDAAVAYPGG